MEYSVFKTPIGYMKMVEEDGFITSFTWVGESAQEEISHSPILAQGKKQIDEYFSGQRKEFTLPVKINATPYRKKVLKALLNVKYGQTVTYGQLAQLTGNPKAARAVGSAMRTNPLVLIVPCHRVLPAGGKLGNYSAGGAENKKYLLALENQNK